jgi:hypothetical protein
MNLISLREAMKKRKNKLVDDMLGDIEFDYNMYGNNICKSLSDSKDGDDT